MRTDTLIRTARRTALAAALLLVGVPSGAAGQNLFDLLAAMRQGGGWVDIPIRGGTGTLLSPTIPTAGLPVNGCLRVWAGHSGTFDIRLRDTQGNGLIEAMARPDQPVRFAYATGPFAQLDARVRWSEARDTTLVVWVGLGQQGGRAGARDPCEPVYGGRGGGR